MNTKLFRMLALVVSLLTAATAFAAPPNIVDGRASVTSERYPQQKAAPTATNVFLQTYNLLTPWLSAAESSTAEEAIMNDWLNGNLRTNAPTTASGYRMMDTNPLPWWAYAVGINGYSTWAGTNGTGIYAGKPGFTAAVLVTVTVVGNGTVALANLGTVCSSPQDSQINQALSFATAGYASTAVGVNADGQPVRSGSGSQPVKRFAVVVYPQLYSAGSASELEGIRTWIVNENNGNFAINVRCTIAGLAEKTATLGTIYTPPPMTVPNLAILRSGSSVVVTVPSGADNRAYTLVMVPTLNSNVWMPIGTVSRVQPYTAAPGIYRLQE